MVWSAFLWRLWKFRITTGESIAKQREYTNCIYEDDPNITLLSKVKQICMSRKQNGSDYGKSNHSRYWMVKSLLHLTS